MYTSRRIYINAGRTLQHKPLSTTEGQRVALMNVGSFTEIRGDSINSGHRWSNKRKISTWIGTSKKKLPMRFDDGCASADITDGTARTSIIGHSLMPMIPSESSICHTNLGSTIYIIASSGHLVFCS